MLFECMIPLKQVMHWKTTTKWSNIISMHISLQAIYVLKNNYKIILSLVRIDDVTPQNKENHK